MLELLFLQVNGKEFFRPRVSSGPAHKLLKRRRSIQTNAIHIQVLLAKCNISEPEDCFTVELRFSIHAHPKICRFSRHNSRISHISQKYRIRPQTGSGRFGDKQENRGNFLTAEFGSNIDISKFYTYSIIRSGNYRRSLGSSSFVGKGKYLRLHREAMDC